MYDSSVSGSDSKVSDSGSNVSTSVYVTYSLQLGSLCLANEDTKLCEGGDEGLEDRVGNGGCFCFFLPLAVFIQREAQVDLEREGGR